MKKRAGDRQRWIRGSDNGESDAKLRRERRRSGGWREHRRSGKRIGNPNISGARAEVTAREEQSAAKRSLSLDRRRRRKGARRKEERAYKPTDNATGKRKGTGPPCGCGRNQEGNGTRKFLWRRLLRSVLREQLKEGEVCRECCTVLRPIFDFTWRQLCSWRQREFYERPLMASRLTAFSWEHVRFMLMGISTKQ